MQYRTTGVTGLELLSVLLIVSKLNKSIDISWVLALAPIWAPIIVGFVLAIIKIQAAKMKGKSR